MKSTLEFSFYPKMFDKYYFLNYNCLIILIGFICNTFILINIIMSKQLEITICELSYKEANDKDEYICLTETEYFNKYSKSIPNKYKEIYEFLTEYEETLQELIGCADGNFILHKEKDYYGWNFSGKSNVFTIFFRGESDLFEAIHLIDNCNLDECPIYDFQPSLDNDKPEFLGNFKTYINLLLTTEADPKILSKMKKKKRYVKMIKCLDKFSDKVVLENYKWIMNE